MTNAPTPPNRLAPILRIMLLPALYIVALPLIWADGHGSGLREGRIEGRNTGRIEVLTEVMKQTAERSQAETAEAEKYTAPDPPQTIQRGGHVTRGAAPFDWQPPQQFQGAALVAVYFTTLDDVRRQCGKDADGCTMHDTKRRPLLIMRSPCTFYDRYALELCHEIGHAQGWPSDHRDGHFIGEDMVDWTNGVLGDDGEWRVLACNSARKGCEVEPAGASLALQKARPIWSSDKDPNP